MKPNDSNIPKIIERIDKGIYTVDREKGVIYKKGKMLGRDSNGYVRLTLSVDGKRIDVFAHRVLYAYYHGADALDEELQINHIDGNKKNNREDNLELVTSSENNTHRFAIGLAEKPKGSKHSQAKLDEETIRKIKMKIEEGYANREIGDIYGISRKYIWEIRKGKKWSHVSV